MKNNVILKFVVAFFGIVAVAGLAFNILAYSQLNQTIRTAENDDQVVTKMVDVANLTRLLMQFDTGNTNQTRQMLSMHLNGELSKVHDLKTSASASIEETSVVLARLVTKAQREHAGYALSMVQPAAH
ncbi:hypothetical protein [Pedosphaera parvula]|uniref:Uncharacterized protein n=1 Tax=Pedosphaera parvula (strain Ellin514) TaxID=320771 RepID=B9XBR8_PEDPL|nr:hypothetical protein [Pedosphaera parvula]EEF62953.1 hypothetical protein Cflav_PD5588 [Pedosphaera parvula Ellin514]